MPPDSTCIDVAVALPVFTSFTYSVPPVLSATVGVGKRVLVPFGRRRVTGYVLGICDPPSERAVKHILDVLDREALFPATVVPLFQWAAEYYMHPLGQVIQTALPGGLNSYDFSEVTLTAAGARAIQKQKATPLEIEILERLQAGAAPLKSILRQVEADVPASIIAAMERRGWLHCRRRLQSGSTRPLLMPHVSLVEPPPPARRAPKPPRQKIIAALKAGGEMPMNDLAAIVPSARAVVKRMQAAGLVRLRMQRVFRDPLGKPVHPDRPPAPNAEQAQVLDTVGPKLGQGFATYLLDGVTGSGKTEVYLRLAALAISRGHQVLVLVPEIALISQTVRCFRARFGERIAVLHSGLTAGERFDQWTRIVRGEVSIAIGARSAIFAPFDRLGLIIVDEEHDSAYKQEGHLRYNARDLAVVRAKLQAAVALLGSATPSGQSLLNATTGKFRELRMTQRVEQRPLPQIELVDLRRHRDARGVRRYLTPELCRAIQATLERGEQVLLFLNRRGFANFPVCAACGEPLRCLHCDISMTYHHQAGGYKCHYCGSARSAQSQCPACGSARFKLLGMGTEKIETAVAALFPQARVARMDGDTTAPKGALLKLLKGLFDRNIDILVGTQMVAKGHDFPNITLVGIVCADLTLSFPDFRAAERTFQLLAQVAGRAGRGVTPGRVILQTYHPGHFSIQAAQKQDFRAFYRRELVYRQSLNYPPLSRMVQIKIAGNDPKKTAQQARSLGHICRTLKSDHGDRFAGIQILGPIEAPIPRIARKYRWQLLLKGSRSRSLHAFVSQLLQTSATHAKGRDVRVAVDVDPVFMS